jgi:hypothetical protein
MSSLGDDVNKLFLTGDLNICALQNEYKPIEDVCENFGLKQVIDIATHNSRLIDHIFLPISIAVHSHGISPPVEKTHAQTWVKVLLSPPQYCQSNITVWKYKYADWKSFNIDLLNSNILANVVAEKSVDKAVELLQSQLQKCMETHIPKASRRNKSNSWVTRELVALHKTKVKSYRKWMQNKTDKERSEY